MLFRCAKMGNAVDQFVSSMDLMNASCQAMIRVLISVSFVNWLAWIKLGDAAPHLNSAWLAFQEGSVFVLVPLVTTSRCVNLSL